MISYNIKSFAFNTFRCEVYQDNNIIAYAIYSIQENKAIGQEFWHLNTELDISVIEGIMLVILNHLKQLNIEFLYTYPIKNKAILNIFANLFKDAVFIKNNTEIDVEDIKLLDYKINSFLCSTGIQDLADEDRIRVIIPSHLGGV